MSHQTYLIPRHANAGVAFLGVEFKDTWLLIASAVVGIIVLFMQETMIGIGILFGGYCLTRALIEWKLNQLSGSLRAYFFNMGLKAYSSTIRHQKTLYVGDSVALYRGSSSYMNAVMKKVRGG